MTSLPKDINQPELSIPPSAQSVLIVTGDNVEDLEFFYPYYRLLEEGYHVDVATPDGGEFKGKHAIGLQHSKRVTDVKEADYSMLYLPGGKAPAKLREDRDVLALTKSFVAAGKPIAAICHGPQILAAAGVVKGVTLTAFPEVEKEIIAAGGKYVNEAVISQGQFTTSRWPGDLPAHMRAVLKALSLVKSFVRPSGHGGERKAA